MIGQISAQASIFAIVAVIAAMLVALCQEKVRDIGYENLPHVLIMLENVHERRIVCNGGKDLMQKRKFHLLLTSHSL